MKKYSNYLLKDIEKDMKEMFGDNYELPKTPKNDDLNYILKNDGIQKNKVLNEKELKKGKMNRRNSNTEIINKHNLKINTHEILSKKNDKIKRKNSNFEIMKKYNLNSDSEDLNIKKEDYKIEYINLKKIKKLNPPQIKQKIQEKKIKKPRPPPIYKLRDKAKKLPPLLKIKQPQLVKNKLEIKTISNVKKLISKYEDIDKVENTKKKNENNDEYILDINVKEHILDIEKNIKNDK